MKKILITIFSLLFYASIALADAVDDRLPPETPDKLKASTRQLMRAGLKGQLMASQAQTLKTFLMKVPSMQPVVIRKSLINQIFVELLLK